MTTNEKIRSLEGQIMEEIDGVKSYINCYVKWKDTNKDIAKIYYDIALQEFEHAKKLHSILPMIIDKNNANDLAIVNFMIELNTIQMQSVSALIGMYKA